MAPRSAGSRNARSLQHEADEMSGIADMVARNRVTIAGATAFAVAFTYVAANAIWYQPHPHLGAFFETRPVAGEFSAVTGTDQTIIRIERETTSPGVAVDRTSGNDVASGVQEVLREREATGAIPVPSDVSTDLPAGDPVVMEVQRVLAGLKFYDGAVDGLTGPRTRDAVEAYRKTMGLSLSAGIDQQLLNQLGISDVVAQPPLPRSSPGPDMIETASAGPAVAAPEGDPMVLRIQAGLKAFGNDGIDIDGIVGARTQSAILEFQSLFGLPETGEPDEALYAKMREIGLTE